MICRATIKKSIKRGLWQIKEENHDLISLSSAHDIIQKIMLHMGFDSEDRRMIHWFYFSDMPIDNYQFQLTRVGQKYLIVDHDHFTGKGAFPGEMFRFFESNPDQLYIKIEEAGYNVSIQGIETINSDRQ